MIRVLHVLHAISAGGITKWLVDILRHMDSSLFHFDFAVHRQTKSPYEQIIQSSGSNIYLMPNRKKLFRYVAELDHLLRSSEPYHVLHAHYHGFSVVPLIVAARNGVAVRIAHLHKDNPIGGEHWAVRWPIQIVCRTLFFKYCTHGFACSSRAADAVWGKRWRLAPRFCVLPYGVEVGDFDNVESREAILQQLGVNSCGIVFGHIGNFNWAKNHEFLLDIFREIQKKCPNSTLLLVGTGEKEQEIRSLVRGYQLERNVFFLGFRADLWRIFRAVDLLLMPSRVEGLPLTVIQAQFAQVPVLASEAIPAEANFSGNVQYLSLRLPASVWARVALELVRRPCEWPNPDTPEVRRFTLEQNARFLASVYSTGQSGN
jgi:glycosyltransferase involved in cell wall biosynthesis